jgi:cytochrome c oxidase subunit 3
MILSGTEPRDLLAVRRPRRSGEVSAFVGMMIFLGGWAMMFAGLFFAYALLRLKAETWPPDGLGRLPIALPAINTALLIAVSGAIALGRRAVKSARPQALTRWVAAAIGLASVFLALQLVGWRAAYLSGLHPDSGSYGSVFYALTCFHGLHVLVGVIGLVSLLPRCLRGAFNVVHHTPLVTWGLYWHFVDAVWVLMFLTVYVV